MISFFIMTVISFSIFEVGTQFFTYKYTTQNDRIFNILSLYNKNNIDDINKNIDEILNKSKGKIIYVTMYDVPDNQNTEYKKLKHLQYEYSKDVQYKGNNKFSYISKQIITEKGIKYDVNIGGVATSSWIPTYINRFKNISTGFLCCFIISTIGWILIKFNDNIHRKYLQYRL